MLIPSKIIKLHEMFEKNYFAYWEDIDFCGKTTKEKYQMYLYSQTNTHSQSFKDRKNRLLFYLDLRNGI